MIKTTWTSFCFFPVAQIIWEAFTSTFFLIDWKEKISQNWVYKMLLKVFGFPSNLTFLESDYNHCFPLYTFLSCSFWHFSVFKLYQLFCLFSRLLLPPQPKVDTSAFKTRQCKTQLCKNIMNSELWPMDIKGKKRGSLYPKSESNWRGSSENTRKARRIKDSNKSFGMTKWHDRLGELEQESRRQ